MIILCLRFYYSCTKLKHGSINRGARGSSAANIQPSPSILKESSAASKGICNMKKENMERKCDHGEPPHEIAYVCPSADTTKTESLASVLRIGSHFALEIGLNTPWTSISCTGTFHLLPQKSLRVPFKIKLAMIATVSSMITY